jgi:hypothetical protein
MTSDGTYLYVADSNVVWRISIADGSTELFAGKDSLTLGTNSSDSSTALLRVGTVTYMNDYLYVTDWSGHTIKKISTNPLASDYRVIQLVAGSHGSSGYADGVGAAARFTFPYGITNDGTSLFIADLSNHVIRAIDPATNTVTTFSGLAGTVGYANGAAGATRFNSPRSIAFSSGFLYVMDSNNIIRQLNSTTGASTFLAGSGAQGNVDGAAGTTSFSFNATLCTDGTDVFSTDFRFGTIRRTTIGTGVTALIAGAAFQNGVSDGNALTTARFSMPTFASKVGNTLYIAEMRSGSIRALDLISNNVTTFSGVLLDSAITPSQAIPGVTHATVQGSRGMVTSDGNRIFFSDFRAHTIRELNRSANTVTTVAGSPGQNGNAPGTGSVARFREPGGLALIGTNLYIADRLNNSIKVMDTSTYAVSNFAGSTAGGTGTGDGLGSAARFSAPLGLATDGTDIFVSDRNNHCIRRVTTAGNVSTLAGLCGTPNSGDGTGGAARFSSPAAIAVSTDLSKLYIGDTGNSTIREVIIATGDVTTIAGTLGSAGSTDGVGLAARFSTPFSFYATSTTLYSLDAGTELLRAIDLSTLSVSTVMGKDSVTGTFTYGNTSLAAADCSSSSGLGGFGSTVYLSCDAYYPLRAIDTASSMVSAIAAKLSGDNYWGITGSKDGSALSTQDTYSQFVVYDGEFLYSADEGNAVIYRMNPDGSGRTTIAGSYGNFGTTDGIGTAAKLTRVAGMELVGRAIYFGQPDSGTIRKLDLATNAVTTIAGTPNVFGSADGVGAAASFYQIQEIVAGDNVLYVLERGNHCIRKVSLTSSDSATVETWAGSAGNSGSADGTGTNARFKSPSGATLFQGSLYVSDTNNSTIRRIDTATAQVSTIIGLAGTPGNSAGVGTNARIMSPGPMTHDGTNLYFRASSVVWRVDPSDYRISPFLGTVDSVSESADGPLSGFRVSDGIALHFYSDLGFLIGSANALKRAY